MSVSTQRRSRRGIHLRFAGECVATGHRLGFDMLASGCGPPFPSLLAPGTWPAGYPRVDVDPALPRSEDAVKHQSTTLLAERDAWRVETPAYVCDLVISAVRYDAVLVAELTALLTPRLRTQPVWGGAQGFDSSDAWALLNDGSRLALVLHQRLWEQDDATGPEATVLRERVRRQPKTVCVVML